MTIKYHISDVAKGKNGFGLPYCDLTFTAILSASSDTTLTVPNSAPLGSFTGTTGNKFLAIITVSADSVYSALNQAAAVPVGASFGASTSVLISANYPVGRYVKAGDVLHFITAATGVNVCVELYGATW